MKSCCAVALAFALVVLLGTAVATPTHFPPGQEPVSQGCFVSMGLLSDDGAAAYRPLPFMVAASSSMTVELCRQKAANRFVAVFGLEYGRECWLDPSNGTLEALTRLGGSEACTMACSGDASFTCGGPYAANLFTLAAPSLDVPLPAYRTEALGCFTDEQLARRMWPLWVSDAMDVQHCAHIAFQEGVLFFALQNGNECWGSQDIAHAQGLGNSTQCSMPCAGNATETCGGPLGNELFAHVDHPWFNASSPAPAIGSATDGAAGATEPPALSGTRLTGSTGPTGPSSDAATGPTGTNDAGSASGPTGGASGPATGSTDDAGTGGDAGGTGPVDPLLQVSDPLASASNLVSSTPQAASPVISQQAERSAAAPVSHQNVLLAAVLAGAAMLLVQ